VKPRHTPFADTIERLETELVNAVLTALRTRALAALDNLLSQSSNILQSVEAIAASNAPARSKARAPSRRTGPTGRPSSRRSAAEDAPAFAYESAPPSKDDAPFTITDPSIVLAEVAALEAPPPPPRRRRARRSVSAPHLISVPAPVEEPLVASAPPALRDGEEVARAVLGGGVVLRRRRA